jgi:ribosomal protein L9
MDEHIKEVGMSSVPVTLFDGVVANVTVVVVAK